MIEVVTWEGNMQTWHDGLPTELPEIVALPERPGMRVRRSAFADSEVMAPRSSELADAWQPPHAIAPLTR